MILSTRVGENFVTEVSNVHRDQLEGLTVLAEQRPTAESLGLPHEGWIPADRWLPPTRTDLLPEPQRSAYRDLRRQLRRGVPLGRTQMPACWGNRWVSKGYRRAWRAWRM